MKKIIILLIAIAATASFASAEEYRNLTSSVAADGINRISLDAGVGDVEVKAADVDAISISVRLEPRRGGFFSSKKKALREVQEAELSVETRSNTLRISIESDSDDRRFEERWRLDVPREIAFELDFGVGDIIIEGIEGGIEIEAGVCDAVIDIPKGAVQADIGVGDITVKMPEDMIGNVECSAGVGSVTIRVAGKPIKGEGFVGDSATYSGNGPHDIVIEVGVGDAVVKAK